MTPLARLIAEARAAGLLRSLPADALAMALAFGVLALIYVATPSNPRPASSASPCALAQHLRCEEAVAEKGEGR